MNAILQVPLQAPVMKRELANKMYSPSAYYLGRFLSNLILQFLYPVIMLLCIFWALDVDESIGNFLWIMSFGLAGNFVFCGQGFFWGIAVPDEDRVKLVNQLNVMIFIMSNGALTNLASANWFVKFLSDISPARFNCEGFFRALTAQIKDERLGPYVISQETFLDQQGYDLGNEKCLLYCGVWFAVWVVLSLITINVKFRKL